MRDLLRARLITATIALVTFPGVPVIADDVDGDGKDDITWWNEDTGQVVFWRMDGASRLENSNVATVADSAWRIVGNGDYNGDGKADFMWRSDATGQVVYWRMDGSSIAANVGVSFVSNPAWQVIASPDLNGDDNSDLLWRHGLTGQVVYWQMNGATRELNAVVGNVSNLSWQIDATADFDGDGNDDILWRDQLTGQIALWTMNGATRIGNFNVATVADAAWQVAGVGRFDAGDNFDILWRNQSTGQNALWLMAGSSIAANLGVPSATNLDWKIEGTGDYDGDNDADIMWRNHKTGQVALWSMNAAQRVANQSVASSTNLNWSINNPGFPQPYSGLAARPSNSSCIAPDEPTTNASIAVAAAFPNLPGFTKPVALLQSPGDTSQWYVVEQDGRVHRFANDPAVDSYSTFIDIDSIVNSNPDEGGLLGMAFHPGYGVSNWYVYLSYTIAGPLRSVVARYESKDGGATLDATDATDLLVMEQPFSNHNGGHIAFGPDGYLYIGFGDGGSGGDPGDNAQNTSNLLGTLLRIDVDAGAPYEIPADNPFALNGLCDDGTGTSACPEIYAWGFRNPWRYNFDSATGDIWLGDVGQGEWEEVDIVALGGNYGWRCREGAHDYDTSGNCPEGLIDPVIELSHASGDGDSITGGFVYRGSAIPELFGRYVFADFVNGKIFASTSDGEGGYSYEELLDTNFNIPSFAEDENGELLFVNYAGDIRRIVQSGGSANNTIPDQLSATGCVSAIDATQPAAGMIPYDLNVPFWSDGAEKERYYAIPNSTTIDVDANGDWLFPNGTVLMKHFRLNGELFETRLFMRHTNGEWAGYTYEWNQAGTDATRVVGGLVKDVQGQSWIYPSESQCMSCHTQAANFSLGLEHAQLNRAFRYPSTGLIVNQLGTADRIGMFTSPLGDDPENLARLFDRTGGGIPVAEELEEASRAYLHSNCSGCHRPLGPAPSDMDLRFSVSFAQTNTCDVEPTSGDLGIANASLIDPGSSATSLIPNRMDRRDVHGMPPLASAIADTEGVDLISQWIDSLTGCP